MITLYLANINRYAILLIMIIRKLNQTDKNQLLILMDEFWMKNQRGELLTGELKEIAALKDPQSQMKIELEQYFDWDTYVADEEGKLLGFVAGRVIIEEDRILDKVGIIEELFVTENARGMKLGIQLMEKILEILAEKNCEVYRTSAYINNTVALSLYRRFGFIDEAIELSRKVQR